MPRIALFILILFHGLIHCMGFARGFGYGMEQFKSSIPKTGGAVWLFTAILFIITAILFLQHKQAWWMIAIPAALLSQILVIINWQDARAGTIANMIIMAAAILSFTSYRFENTYKKSVTAHLAKDNSGKEEWITEKDLLPLPLPVQQYLRYAGVVNKRRINNVRIMFEGQMRDKGKNWFSFTSEQYNFFKEPTRLFFMKGKMFGITVPGYHHYIQGKAVMDIRLFGLFPIIQKDGPVMDKTETVTLFNDMCLLAPATLIDKRIQWQAVNDSVARAIFTNRDISIEADLFFNTRGQLINFVSHDRTSVNEMKTYPFSTPVTGYGNFNGYNLISAAEAIWHYPDGDFTYGKFSLKGIEYNVTSFIDK